jgi:flagellin-like hook-associated protein FlgL
MIESNIGQAFPLESLGSDIARNDFNYQSILNGLVEWDKTDLDYVTIRLTKESAPYYMDYTIPSRTSIFKCGNRTSQITGRVNSLKFSVSSILSISVYGGEYVFSGESVQSTTIPGDSVILRLTDLINGNGAWKPYYIPTMQTWSQYTKYRKGNYFQYGTAWYVVNNNFTASTATPVSGGTSDYSKFYRTFALNTVYQKYDLVYYSGSIYEFTGTSELVTIYPDSYSKFDAIAPVWAVGEYSSGDYVTYTDGNGNPNMFFCVSSVAPMADATPDVDTVHWKPGIAKEIPNIPLINSTVVIRWDANIDSSYFIMRNMSAVASASDTNMEMSVSIKTAANPSIYNRTVDVLDTSNFVMWPDDKSIIWGPATASTPTATVEDNDIAPITKRQNYSASMVFRHADPSTSTVNFVNYDGPDLDQGLCIYLPIEVSTGESEYSVPEDGFTYEFYFRIWPLQKYMSANSRTRDHIVNKAQIYVYSANSENDISNDGCGYPIAKFSMARMTSFYVFAENITIPDKPVIYRATFIYSKNENQWMCLDYYQLPDHVFVGPVGFIDPQNPSSSQGNSTTAATLPDPSFIGYETCAFPTFVDPFSNPDLTPYRDDGTFYSRII